MDGFEKWLEEHIAEAVEDDSVALHDMFSPYNEYFSGKKDGLEVALTQYRSRTCKMEVYVKGKSEIGDLCTVCGAFAPSPTPNYCPNCGRKVV